MKRTDSFAQQKTHNHQLPGSNTNPLEIASTANYDRHKTNTSLGLTTISVIYDRRQRLGGPKRSALQRFPARLNLSHPYSHLQVRLLTPMANRLTFSRNSLRSNVHSWTKQKSSSEVHRTLSPRTTHPSPSRRFRSQPCSAIYVNYQRTKLQLCRMDKPASQSNCPSNYRISYAPFQSLVENTRVPV